MELHTACTDNSNNPRYKCTTTKTKYDIGAHSSLPTLAIITLGLPEKKNKKQFCVGSKKHFNWHFTSVFEQF